MSRGPSLSPTTPGGPTLLQEAKVLLQQYGLAPAKGRGQNFLISRPVLERISRLAELSPHDLVVEVGPGLGFLTRVLAREAGFVEAIEIDAGLARALRELFGAVDNVRIRHEDVLALDLGALLAEHETSSYQVVANLPYHITTPVLRLFLEHRQPPGKLLVMVQREVAQRIIAQPGEMNYLSVLVQFYGQAKIVGSVPRAAFYPQPRVTSALLQIRTHPRRQLKVADPEIFFQIVSAGFSHPRKQLHNALAHGLGLSSLVAPQLLRQARIDPQRRAQTLSLDEWAELYAAVAQFRAGAFCF